MQTIRKRIRKIADEYVATARVWAEVFSSLDVGIGTDETKLFQEVYERWCQKDGVEATIAWARWLLMKGRGKEATEVVVSARSRLKEPEWTEIEKRWTVVLDGAKEGVVKVNVEE